MISVNLGFLVTFYEIKKNNLEKLFWCLFLDKCGWFCFYWKSHKILSNLSLKINKRQIMTLLIMEDDTGITQFSQCSSPGHILSLLSSLVISPVAPGEHSVDCTLKLSWHKQTNPYGHAGSVLPSVSYYFSFFFCLSFLTPTEITLTIQTWICLLSKAVQVEHFIWNKINYVKRSIAH